MPPGHDDAATVVETVNVNICTPSPFSPTHAGDKNADVLRCISTVMTFMMPTGTTSARCQTGPAPHSTGTNGSDGKTHLHFCLIAFGIENQMEKKASTHTHRRSSWRCCMVYAVAWAMRRNCFQQCTGKSEWSERVFPTPQHRSGCLILCDGFATVFISS